jgi:hypothetical protein
MALAFQGLHLLLVGQRAGPPVRPFCELRGCLPTHIPHRQCHPGQRHPPSPPIPACPWICPPGQLQLQKPSPGKQSPYSILQLPLLFQDRYHSQQHNPCKRANKAPTTNSCGGGSDRDHCSPSPNGGGTPGNNGNNCSGTPSRFLSNNRTPGNSRGTPATATKSTTSPPRIHSRALRIIAMDSTRFRIVDASEFASTSSANMAARPAATTSTPTQPTTSQPTSKPSSMLPLHPKVPSWSQSLSTSNDHLQPELQVSRQLT